MFNLYANNDQLFRTEDDGVLRPDTDALVDRPAILIDAENDLLLKWGSFNNVAKVAKQYEPFAGIENMPQVALFQLNQLTAEEQAYVINRMLRYTATNFVRNFAEQGTGVSGKDWLKAEMERLPLD